MTDPSANERLALAVIEQGGVVEKRPPSRDAWPFDLPEPDDLRALYNASNGVTLSDGTRILPRGELAETTAWLVEDRSLEWDDDIVVIGERADMVIARDLDRDGARAGGGVLEAPHDALESFRRVARGVIGYLAARAGLVDLDPAPEIVLERAVSARDEPALTTALALSFYPGHARDVALAALTLGSMRAARGDEPGALAAFERFVAERVGSVGRGAASTETSAAWRACAIAAKGTSVEAECERRAIRR